ncbi:ribonuclease M5 [Salisediminibacterium beveridgei]|uniref:ribonuclease M5 n=1 Tax=Salisediminibacterium beveridgei TaxID=632773 RepID=UPI0008480371|nr:ribonuclease M5 [Salisediminibacterium beveridgei]
MRIEEMIVVEGKNDTLTLKRWFDCDTIETNGSAIPEVILERIALALERRGVIVFTDPDFPGEKVRKVIDQEVPGCAHAFLPKADATDHKKRKVGIEHAGFAALKAALNAARSSTMELPADFDPVPFSRLMEAGLIAGADAKKRREQVGELLGIGYNNSKQLVKRLEQFRISVEEFEVAMKQLEKEQNE